MKKKNNLTWSMERLLTYMPLDGSPVTTVELCERFYGRQTPSKLASITSFMKGAQKRLDGTSTSIWHSSYQGPKSGAWKMVRRI